MATANPKPLGSYSSNTSNEFIQLAKEVCRLADQAGCKLIPFAHPSVPHFSSLEDSKKAEVINSLHIFVDICHQAISEGKSLKDSSSLTWYALKKLKLRFPSNLFEFITSDSIVEIYDQNNIQMFRNFRFFDVVSYTLEDIYCRPWTDLFIRDNMEQTQHIIDAVTKFYTGKSREITNLEYSGTHKIKEADSPFRFTVDLVINHVAPIYHEDKSPAGFIAIETGQLTCSVPKGIQAESLLKAHFEKHQPPGPPTEGPEL